MIRKLKRHTASLATGGLLLFGLAIAGNAAAGEVYQWRDDQGRLHFSDQPPAEAEHQRFQHSGRIADAPAPSTSEQDTPPTVAGDTPSDCATARQQLADYEQSARIVEHDGDGDGTPRTLDAQEREALIALQRDLVERLCAN